MAVPAAPRPLYADRRFVIAVSLLGIIALALLALLREATDGMQRYPHAFVQTAGYDPALVQVRHAPIETPPEPPAGCQRAWRCDDPAFNDRAGRAWIFPMADSGEQRPTPPRHPGLQRSPDLETCSLYRTPEAVALLEAYRTRRFP